MSNNKTDRISPHLIIVIVSLAALTFMGILSETSLNIAYATLMNEFSINASTIQWLTTGYLLVLSIAIPVSPFLVRKFPTKRLFQTAVLTFLTGTIIAACAPNFIFLLLGRLIMAAGTGISLPLLTNIVLEKASPAQRGLLLGIVGLVTNFAPAIGPCFGGLIMQFLNWHWIFIVMLPILLLSFLGGSSFITDIRKGEKAVIDFPSVLLTSLFLTSIVISLSVSSEWNWDFRVWLLFLLGLVSAAFFVRRQLRLEAPLIQVRVFRHPAFTTGIAMIMIATISVLGCAFLMPILLQKGLGYSSMVAALILLPAVIINGIVAPLVGTFLNKVPAKLFLLVGFFIASLSLFSFIKGNYTVLFILICYAAFMLGAAFIQVPAQTNALNQLPPKNYADGSALMNTLQQVSGAIGTALASSFLTVANNSYVAKGLDAEQAYLSAFPDSIPFFLVICLIGIILAIITQKNKISVA